MSSKIAFNLMKNRLTINFTSEGTRLSDSLLSHMKTSLLFRSLLFRTAFGILGLAAAQVIAQTQISTTTGTSGHVQTSKLIGTKVKTAQGEEVGVIKDVVLDRSNGCMAYTVLSTGGAGTRGVGQAKTVAVPWTVYSPTSDLSVLTVSVDRDRIYNAPVFEYARIDEYATSGYINNVYSYYGVSGQVGVAGQTSVTGGATTTTGATTSATASPMASASPTAAGPRAYGTVSPRAAASPTATASAMATEPAGATATASPKGTRRPSREESTSGQPKSSATPASRGRDAERMTTPKSEEATSESTGSPSKERSKSSRHRATGETAEPSATPEQE
jgi:sporulation protein YlmC with PRC-barrel domain